MILVVLQYCLYLGDNQFHLGRLGFLWTLLYHCVVCRDRIDSDATAVAMPILSKVTNIQGTDLPVLLEATARYVKYLSISVHSSQLSC